MCVSGSVSLVSNICYVYVSDVYVFVVHVYVMVVIMTVPSR